MHFSSRRSRNLYLVLMLNDNDVDNHDDDGDDDNVEDGDDDNGGNVA